MQMYSHTNIIISHIWMYYFGQHPNEKYSHYYFRSHILVCAFWPYKEYRKSQFKTYFFTFKTSVVNNTEMLIQI